MSEEHQTNFRDSRGNRSVENPRFKAGSEADRRMLSGREAELAVQLREAAASGQTQVQVCFLY